MAFSKEKTAYHQVKGYLWRESLNQENKRFGYGNSNIIYSIRKSRVGN